jgi:hypothetical protein
VFGNKVLRAIFVPKRDEVTGGRRTLHKEEMHNLYSSPNIVRLIKLRHVTQVVDTRNTENLKERSHLTDLEMDGMVRI